MTVVRVGEVWVEDTSYAAAISYVIDAARARGENSGSIRLVNAWSIVLAQDDASYASILNSPGKSFPDGLPLAKYLKMVGPTKAASRVRGPSLFLDVLDNGRAVGLRHYFLGSTPETMRRLVNSIETRFPGVEVAGYWAPPFGPVDDAFVREAGDRIRDAEPHVVWLGLGTPKQDFAAHDLAKYSGLTTVAVGAAFDFAAATVREAPSWVQNSGAEWLFRLLSEPRRLWKRYLIGNIRFLAILARTSFVGRSARERGSNDG